MPIDSRAEIDAIKPVSRTIDVASSRRDDEIFARRPIYTISLLVLMTFLLIAGALNLYSASGGDAMFYSHMKQMSIGLGLFIVLAFVIQPKHLSASAYWFYGLICVALVGVLVGGHIGWGARRWLQFGPISGQPSELGKIAIAMVGARFFAEMQQMAAYRLRDLWLLALLVGVMFVLIFPQPDLGTASFLVLIVCTQICFMPIEWRSVAMLFSGAAITLPIGWHFLLLGYQKTRILSFLDPSYEPQGKGYNVQQSLVAVGSGGMYGKGFMHGTQTHLKFLPMSHSDFIFSVFAEEHGFLGGSLLLLSFAALASLALLIAKQSKNTFSALLAVGLGAFLFIEFAINVAMVLRMFPVKGLPLPFFSAGGSNLIVSCAAIGILISIDRDNRGKFRNRHLHVYKN
ncbi:MAG: rod shape-determining protein RodA [Deltaproteobacteria bacterium]|nr:rod shape-determining protein RodA [Deltaproteobacteria bacterium]